MNSRQTVCVITCYKQPDYIRAKTIRKAIADIKGVDLIVVKNKHRGILRYPEVMAKTLIVRVLHRPDIYILTFRGYEMLIPIRLLTIGKKLVFDEFINLIEWVVYEHKKLKENSLAHKLILAIYRFWLRRVHLILADTESHADLSSQILKIPRRKFHALVVSTDENTFIQTVKPKNNAKKLQALYYGSMLPLHGVDVVIRAMILVKDKNIEATIIGGNKYVAESIHNANNIGAHIKYKNWVDFEELPGYMQRADVCLAGPFGDTFQSRYVITGKAYQYMMMKRPIIIGKNKESRIFTDKKDSLIVDRGSAIDLANALVWAYEHKDALQLIGDSGYRLYQSKLSNKVLKAQVEKLLLAL